MHGTPLITVFTATYNRAATLARVYESLAAQTYTDFEWVIVDDGSTDHTQRLVSTLEATASFPIRYIWKENGGKHTALNVGVNQARGRLFLILDSDDACVATALERFAYHWRALTEEDRRRVSTITGLCRRPDGAVVGPGFPFESRLVESPVDQMRLREGGERWGINLTSALREFPFPEVPGERFIAESVVWNRMAQKYCCKFVNEALRVYVPGDGGLSRRLFSHRLASPVSASLVYEEYLKLQLAPYERLKHGTNYWRFWFHSLKMRRFAAVSARKASGRDVPALILGGLFFLADLVRVFVGFLKTAK